MPTKSQPPEDETEPGEDPELTAYLDGELDDAAAREVEAWLARDPAARKRADDLKKSYDLLDYLPKRDPSADFATRTMTKLLPSLSDAARPPAGSTPAAPPATTGSRSGGSTMILEPIEQPRSLGSKLRWLAASAVVLVVAYFAHSVARPYLDGPEKDRGDLAADYRMLVHLPWYLGVDDLDFLKRLDEPELFAPDAAASESGPRVVPVPEPNPAATDRHIELFQTYSPARRQQLRKLDQELHELPTTEQDRLRRVLEEYAVWLDRLNEADRREVLSQPNSVERLDAVRRLCQKQWRESLPEPVRKKIAGTADVNERLEFIRQFKSTQKTRREEWTLARRQWDTLNGPDRKEPWPFSEPHLAKALDDYVRNVFKIVDIETKFEVKAELPNGMRLTRQELFELRETRRAAVAEGKWFLFGLTMYRLAEKHPSLPEPGGKPAFTNTAMIPADYRKDVRYLQWLKPIENKSLNRGKWPELALEVADAPRRLSIAGVGPPSSFFGPCKPGEFTDEVNKFLSTELLPKLTDAERSALNALEGKWPEYPRKMLAYAKKPNVDLPVPGVTLPGKPSLWTRYYDFVVPPAPSAPAK